jgi:hypothetical protein
VDLVVVSTTSERKRRETLRRLVDAFQEAAMELRLDERIDSVDAERLGRDLAHDAEIRIAWETAIGDHLTVPEAVEALGLGSRQAVYQRIQRGTLLAVELDGQLVLPRYQFGPGRPDRRVAKVLRLLRSAQLRADSLVSWFATGQPELEGLTPADWLRKDGDPEALYDAARHTTGALAH